MDMKNYMTNYDRQKNKARIGKMEKTVTATIRTKLNDDHSKSIETKGNRQSAAASSHGDIRTRLMETGYKIFC